MQWKLIKTRTFATVQTHPFQEYLQIVILES
jgi:hypothetical protein